MSITEPTAAQLDGLACIGCGRDAREAGPMVPSGTVDGHQVFDCERCSEDEHLDVLATTDPDALTLALREQLRALQAEVTELRRYVPMLARMRFFEEWSSAGTIPQAVLRLEEWTRLADHDNTFAFGGLPWNPPEFAAHEGEAVPAAAQALQDAYNRRESPEAAKAS